MKKKKIIIGVIAAIIVAALIIVIISLAGNSKDKGQEKGKGPSNKPTCAHDDPSQIVVVKAIEPTCMGFGFTEGKQCKKCDTMIASQTKISKIDCVEGEWTVEQEPTDTEDGYECTRCIMCGEIINERIIPAGTGD